MMNEEMNMNVENEVCEPAMANTEVQIPVEDHGMNDNLKFGLECLAIAVGGHLIIEHVMKPVGKKVWNAGADAVGKIKNKFVKNDDVVEAEGTVMEENTKE